MTPETSAPHYAESGPLPGQPLARLLQRTRASLRRHYVLEALGGVLVFAALAFTVALAVAWVAPVSRVAHLVVGGVALVFASAFVYGRAIRPSLRFRTEDAVALYLERAFPTLRSRLISAVQLGRDLPALERDAVPHLSPALVRALIHEASAESLNLDVRRALPRRSYLRNLALTLLIGALITAFAAAFPERMERALSNLAGALAIKAASATTDEGPPLIGDVALRYAYPEYTGYAARAVEGSTGTITAIKGTVVHWSARAAFDVQAAEIKVGKETLPLRVQGHGLEGELVVKESGPYEVWLVDDRGKRLRATSAMRIEAELDRLPKVRILTPGPEVIVGERGRVEVRFAADDDFGLRELSLVYKVEGSSRPERVLPLRPFEKTPRTVDDTHSLSIFDLGFRPGERIAYKLRVHDNDTVSGPKHGDSATQYIKVFSPRERHLELLDEEKRIWEEMVHLLGEQVVLGEDAKGRDAPALAASEGGARKATERASKIVARLDSLLREARADKMFDARASATLEGVRRRIRERMTREATWHTGSVGLPESRLPMLASFMPRHIEGIEADVLLVDKLVKQQKIEALKALTRELQDSQKRLRSLLERYRKTKDPELRAEIEREIARLEEKMKELRAKLAELFDVDDEFVNLDAIKARDMQRRAEEMKEALQKGDLDKALERLERMSKDLENTLEKVDLSAKAFYDSAFYKGQKEMEKLLDEVHELEAGQKDVQRQTSEVEKTARSRAAKETDVAKSDAARRAYRKLEEVSRKAAEAAQGMQSRWNRELAEKGQARAEDAARALGQGDAAETLDMAKRGLDHLKQLDENLQRERPWRIEPETQASRAAQEAARRAQRGMQEVVRELERMVPRAGDKLTEGERGRMSELARKERQLRERTGQLKKRMEQMGEDAPFFGDGAKESLEKAHDEMSQAEGQLGKGRPRRAAQHEQGALESLGRLKDQVQQAMKSGAGQGDQDPKDGEGSGRQRSAEPVKIPGAEEHQSPKEFREDLLKAMKQGVPGAYQDLVRRYYEELVR